MFTQTNYVPKRDRQPDTDETIIAEPIDYWHKFLNAAWYISAIYVTIFVVTDVYLRGEYQTLGIAMATTFVLVTAKAVHRPETIYVNP